MFHVSLVCVCLQLSSTVLSAPRTFTFTSIAGNEREKTIQRFAIRLVLTCFLNRLATDEDDGQVVREITASGDDKEITSPLARYSVTFITGCVVLFVLLKRHRLLIITLALSCVFACVTAIVLARARLQT